jgi:hypothetical protein
MLLLGVWLLRARTVPARIRWRNVALPLGAAMVALVAATACYNWRDGPSSARALHSAPTDLRHTQTLFWQPPIQDAQIHGARDIADVFQ